MIPIGAILKMPFQIHLIRFIHLNVENILEIGLSINIFDINGRNIFKHTNNSI